MVPCPLTGYPSSRVEQALDGPPNESTEEEGVLNTEEFIPHEAGSPFGWIEPEIAQYPKST